MDINEKRRLIEEHEAQERAYVKSNERMVGLGVKGIETYVSLKQLLIFLFEIVLKKMIEYNVFSLSHEYNDYSIRVNIKRIVKEDQKPKRNELIPLYDTKKFITPN